MKNLNKIYVAQKVHRGWHIYSKKSLNHYFFENMEYEKLKYLDLNPDVEFYNYLKSIHFFKKKQKWYDFKIPIVKVNKKLKFKTLWNWFFMIITFIILVLLALPISRKFFPSYTNNYVNTFVIVFLSSFLHEISHWLSANYCNVYSPTMGINFKWFLPMPYTDLTGISYLTSKNKKIFIILSGIISNVYIVLISYICSWFTNINIFNDIFYANLILIITNLMFYIKLDGYYIIELFLEEKIISYSKNDFKLNKLLPIRIFMYILFLIFIVLTILGVLRLWHMI